VATKLSEMAVNEVSRTGKTAHSNAFILRRHIDTKAGWPGPISFTTTPH
jgi:hypothetical protein